MTKLTAFEAKTRFGELLERVAAGEEIVITRHDKPVARVIPEGLPRRDQVRNAVAGLRNLRQQILRRGVKDRRRARLSDREVRTAIDEGRP
jgi:prevent-host-death family protein